MYIIKIDLPTGTAYFTGKKRVTQGCESPGLADTEEGACTYETAEEATRMCKMLFRKFDMEFYYTEEGAEPQQPLFDEENEEPATEEASGEPIPDDAEDLKDMPEETDDTEQAEAEIPEDGSDVTEDASEGEAVGDDAEAKDTAGQKKKNGKKKKR